MKARLDAAAEKASNWYRPEHIWNLLLLGMLFGVIGALLYGLAYSLGRFFTEGLRTDSLCVGPYTLDGSCAGGLRIAQIVSLVAFGVCGALLTWRRRPGTGTRPRSVGVA